MCFPSPKLQSCNLNSDVGVKPVFFLLRRSQVSSLVLVVAAATAALQPDCTSEGGSGECGPAFRGGLSGLRREEDQGGVCQDKQVCRGVPPGPVSDAPSLGGVGAAGCTITSPWAPCNYALT